MKNAPIDASPIIALFGRRDRFDPQITEVKKKHQDVPMDLTDDTLVVAAEQRGIREIFSIDSDFYVHRTTDRGRNDELITATESPRRTQQSSCRC